MVSERRSENAARGEQLPVINSISSCQAMTDKLPVYQVCRMVDRYTWEVLEGRRCDVIIASYAKNCRVCIHSAYDRVLKPRHEVS